MGKIAVSAFFDQSGKFALPIRICCLNAVAQGHEITYASPEIVNGWSRIIDGDPQRQVSSKEKWVIERNPRNSEMVLSFVSIGVLVGAAFTI